VKEQNMMRRLIERVVDSLGAQFSRFARFEELLLARRAAMIPVVSPSARYAGLDRPAYLRRGPRRVEF
jgi:hypothetical protein